MDGYPLNVQFSKEDYQLFKKAYNKALITRKEYFDFKGNIYLTKFARELVINNNGASNN